VTEVYKDEDVVAPAALVMRGRWSFDGVKSLTACDASANAGSLLPVGNVHPVLCGDAFGSVELDGESASLGTEGPVLRTDRSFTVAAWVRLSQYDLEPGNFAFTAVSQDSPSHSAFYLGARAFEELQPDGSMRLVLRWNFTVAPVDGSVTGVLEWRHASSSQPIARDDVGRWTFLVGVCDVENRLFTLHLPGLDDGGVDRPPPAWNFWQADGGFQVGRALWLGRPVDYWPGAVGSVCAYEGAMSVEDVNRLYAAQSRPD
jgi:hypothetical protein